MSDTPWITKQHDLWEVNTTADLRVYCGANNIIEIDKMYGPLSASPVRIQLQYNSKSAGEWVVEYQNPTTEVWEEKARWSCQENWPQEDGL